MTRLAAALCLVLLAAPALGQAPTNGDEPSAEDRATARSLMDLGDEKLAAGDLAAALEAYSGADALMGVPTTAIEVAKTQAKLGLLVEAADTLNRVLRFPKKDDEPKPFTKAREDARVLMTEVTKRTPSLKVIVQGAPAGAELRVAVDEELLRAETMTLPRKVNPGKHKVRAAAGELGAIEDIEVAEREKRELVLKLAPGVETGLEAMVAEPEPEPEPQPLPDPQPQRPDEAASGGISPLVWIGFGVGAAGLIAGGITGGLTLSREKDLQTSCPDKHCTSADAQSELDSSMTLAHVSTAMFAVGGAGIAVGVVGLLLSDFGGASEQGAAEQGTIEPLIGPTSLGVKGRF